MAKRCIILSQGPVPTPEHKQVEGGGLRCWGLAFGIKANQPGIEVTVAYNDSYKQNFFTKDYKNIHITTWTIDSVKELIQDFDTVIVSYCMGELSMEVADNIQPQQQLVLDCYVPIYVEVSARNSDDLEREYADFHYDVGKWAHILRRGDIFLCASEAQRRFYMGVLSAVGRINPATYGDNMILIAPYGIYRDEPVAKSRPITKLVGKDVKKILWFGGIYPWFDLKDLIEAVKEVNKTVPAHLIIVGAKNPFNAHPDFVRRYDEMIEYIDSNTGVKDLVILQDWVPFEDRADWYLDSDLVVVVNKLGDENELAWRTRLVDFTWANLPIITNGGDALGELLINQNAAAQFSKLEPSIMARDITLLLKNGEALDLIKRNLSKVKPRLYWDAVTKELASSIKQHKRARDLSQFGVYEATAAQDLSSSQLKRVVSKARRLPAYTKKYGFRNTYFAVKTIATRKARQKIGQPKRQPRLVVLSHQLDLSGAPFVLIDLLRQLKQARPKDKIDFYTFNPAHRDNIKALNELGIKPKIFLNRDITLEFGHGDVLLANTVHFSALVKESIYSALKDSKLKKLIWYTHEDNPGSWFSPAETRRIKNLLKQKKIIFFGAAQQLLNHYQQHFDDTSQIKLQPYKIVTDKKYHKLRKPADFHKITFILPGNTGDARKGQLPIFYAFIDFFNNYYKSNPKKYRDFKLIFIGLGNDLISKQILNHAQKGLGKRFEHYGQISKDRYHDLLLKSNMTICYSVQESLPLFVFEGMTAGHPIMRNDSSGMEEQLRPGKNGFYLDSKDYKQVIETIEKVLNLRQTSSELLAKMSRASYDIAKDQENNTYKPMIDEII